MHRVGVPSGLLAGLLPPRAPHPHPYPPTPAAPQPGRLPKRPYGTGPAEDCFGLLTHPDQTIGAEPGWPGHTWAL